MNPVAFEGQNVVFAKDQPEYLPLPAYVDPDGVEAITCWELTDEEIEELKSTKRIWLSQLIFCQPLQPQRPSVERPLRGISERV